MQIGDIVKLSIGQDSGDRWMVEDIDGSRVLLRAWSVCSSPVLGWSDSRSYEVDRGKRSS